MVSQCEALNVAEYLETKALIGCEATKDTILTKLTQTTLVHIATYGSWEDSVLVVGPSPSSQPNEDGSHDEDNYQIGAKDIMNIQMKADLVILSSCYGDIHRDVDFTLPSALLAAGCKCVIVILWAIPDIAREKFWYHFYKTLQDGNYVSVAMAKAKENLAQDERFTDPMYWAPFLMIGQDVYICVHQIKHAMLDQLVDTAEKEVLQAMPVNALNISPEPAEVSSQEITLPKLRQNLSTLLEHHVEHPKAIPLLLQLVTESLTLLLNPQKDLLTRKLAQPAMVAPGAIPLLNLVGFHFQAKGAYNTEPYVVFPHWDHDGLLQPAHQALKALVDLTNNSPCCSALSKLLVGSEDALSGLLDIVSITKHSWEIQLKVTDIGVRSLWGHHTCRDLLTSIGFQQVGVLLLFTNTSLNRKLLNGSLHVLASVLGEKGQAMLDKVDVNYLGVTSRRLRSASSMRPGSKSLKLPSLNPILLSRNRVHMSTPWLTLEGGEDEKKLKIQMAQNLSDVYSEYRYYLMKAHDWQNYSLKPQASQALASIGEPKPKPKVVKVKAGFTSSMNRVPVEQEPTLTIAGIEQRRDYSNFLLHSRSESILARHKEAARKVYLPYVKKLAQND
ncbi:tetratricopeptide repeat protein 28-like [Glandiceps talaboti]